MKVGEKKNWGVFHCKCGQAVTVTMEVIKVGEGIANLFEAKCSCGREASNHYPEKVLRELRGVDEDS
jgi:hypothetical protein